MMRHAMVTSALESAAKAEEVGLAGDKIILSCKVSSVQDLIAIYRELSKRADYALHLGLTEAGMGSKGIVASTAALSVLLQEGIGDTIRVSLTPEPGGSRSQEVIVAQEILQTMGLRAFTPMVAACPGCGRTTSTFFQELAGEVQDFVRAKMPEWKLQVRRCREHDAGRHGLHRQRSRANRSTPTSASRCRAPAKPLRRRSTKMARRRSPSRATTSPTNSRHHRALRRAHLQEETEVMSQTLQAVRGMNDILPDEAEFWELFEDTIRSWLKGYGYRPIRMPIVEPTPLFKRAIGEVTDIVEKEMYSFIDSLNGEALTCARKARPVACAPSSSTTWQPASRQRLYYIGQMFRHERPQKGRYRQFHQVGVEAFGMPDRISMPK
jgi:hypothetical protein